MPAEANNSWAQGLTQADVPVDVHACSRKLNTDSGVHHFPKKRSASYSKQLLQQNECLKTQTSSGVQESVTTCQLCTCASVGWCDIPPFNLQVCTMLAMVAMMSFNATQQLHSIFATEFNCVCREEHLVLKA